MRFRGCRVAVRGNWGPPARRPEKPDNARHTAGMEPGKPSRDEWRRGREPYWRRRFYVLTGILGVIGLVAWGCSAAIHVPKQPAQPAAATADATQQATPSARPTPTRSAPAKKQRARKKKRTVTRAHRTGSGCAPADVVVSLLVSRDIYRTPAEPRFTIYVVNAGRRTCTLDVGPRSLRLVVKSGPVHEWSPADCARGSVSDVIRLARGVPLVKHVSWNRMRSDPGCPLPREAASPGTYTATVTDGAARSRTVVFLLR